MCLAAKEAKQNMVDFFSWLVHKHKAVRLHSITI
jgi:hypothetical protein